MTERAFDDKGIDITVTRSAGTDGAFVVFIDTAGWEPDGSDGGPGLRVLLNDGEIFDDIPYGSHPDGWPDKAAGEAHFFAALKDVDYLKDECRHCGRRIELQDGRWVDPGAGTDVENGDGVWRETCDRHDTFMAEHEPVMADDDKGPAVPDAELSEIWADNGSDQQAWDPYGGQKHRDYEENS